MKSIVLLEKIPKISLFLLVFLIPLWFLPFTQNVLAYQKQALLVVLVFIGVIAWLSRAMNKGEITLRLSLLHAPVLLLLLVTAISTIFSLSRYGSLWGWPLNVTDSFLTILAFALFYFLLVNTVTDMRKLFYLVFVLIVSATIAGLFAMLQLMQIFLLPFDFTAGSNFNTVGTVNSVALLAAVLIPLSFVSALVTRLFVRWFLWVTTLVLLFVVVGINFFDAWIAMIAGLVVLVVFGVWNLKGKGSFGWIYLPMGLVVIALFFVLFRISVPISLAIPAEISPSITAEFTIVKDVAFDSPLRAIVGSGPGTFMFQYSKFHSALLNQTIFWGTRFSVGASEFLDWIVTKGFFGIVSLLALIVIALFVQIRKFMYIVKKEKIPSPSEPKKEGKVLIFLEEASNFSWMLQLGLLASFAAIVVTQLLHPANFTLWFVFWFLLAGLGLAGGKALRTISLAPPSLVALGVSFLFLLVLVFGLGLLFIGGQKYLAEVQYLKGVRASQVGDAEEAVASLSRAASLNSSVDLYWRDLAQLYLSEANRIAGDGSIPTEQRQQQTQLAVANALNTARRATQVAESNVANWNVQGFVYRSVIGVPGAADFALSSYEEAKKLNPASPFPWTELGRVHILRAQQSPDDSAARDEDLNKAVEQLKTAVELKADYSPAHYLLAVAYDQQGNSTEAVATLQESRQFAPNDVGLAFQLGVVYWQLGQLEQAQAEFERARAINPGYANARYMLGLVYDRQGERAGAIEEFSVVASLNPTNEEIKRILANLNSRRSALEGITPSQPPIEEPPPEIGEEE